MTDEDATVDAFSKSPIANLEIQAAPTFSQAIKGARKIKELLKWVHLTNSSRATHRNFAA